MAAIAMQVQNVAESRVSLRACSDADLAEVYVLAGDELTKDLVFSELVQRYQGRLLNFIYRTIGDREKAEDLVQEIFLRVYRHLRRFDRSKKFSTWIYTIASNLVKNELRNRSRNPLMLFSRLSAAGRLTTTARWSLQTATRSGQMRSFISASSVN